MKFSFIEPKAGDMIRIKVGSIYHYGVYCSDELVVQFGLAPNLRPGIKDCQVEVCTSTIEEFVQDGFLEVAELDKKELKKRIKPQKTVELAKSKIGQKGYNIIYNNCEHFAYECVMGEKKCSQADDLRAFFRSLPVVNLFIAPIKDSVEERLYPQERQDLIDKTNHETTKLERYSAWKLLEYALNRSFGYKIKDLTFKCENGKWTCDKCYFSLSHSGGYAAVVVSREPCGVDIENKEIKDELIDKVLTKKEKQQYALLGQKSGYMLEKWVLKESIFKTLDKKSFNPTKIEVEEFTTWNKQITLAEKDFVVAVCTNTPDKVKVFLDCKY